jgi:suppressor of fused-like protein
VTWDAIDAALNRIYPGVEPVHLATVLKYALGGPDPLDGVSIYPRPDHWHLVSYGLSELYDKESDDPDVSGWGFELTIRVARTADPVEPVWAVNLMQNLARYVFSTGNVFGPGHHLDLNGPIRTDQPETAIRAIAFAHDPELPPIDTPHGGLEFLQIVGLTLDEYAACQRWETGHLLAALEPHLPLLQTDVTRESLLHRPEVAAAVDAGIRRDGSSTGSVYVTDARWTREQERTIVTFGANAAEHIAAVLAGRLPHGRGLAVDGPHQHVLIRPAAERAITEISGETLELSLPPDAVSELTGLLRPVAGVYPLSTVPDLAIEIIRSQIRDRDGNVVREVG